MMFKVFGVVFVVFFCTVFGMKNGQIYIKRSELLSEIAFYLTDIKNNLIYRKDTKQFILKHVGLNTNLKHVNLKITKNNLQDFECELEKEIDKFTKENNICLKEDELLLFKSTLFELGSTGSKEEEQKLLYAIEFFEEKAKISSGKAKEQSKLYRTLGFCSGVAIALMLL